MITWSTIQLIRQACNNARNGQLRALKKKLKQLINDDPDREPMYQDCLKILAESEGNVAASIWAALTSHAILQAAKEAAIAQWRKENWYDRFGQETEKTEQV
jgi:DNA-binding SARP family transcriptional activator